MHLGEPGGGAWEERKWQGCPVDAVGSAKNLLILKNMYFLGVKSTAHPPIIGALGHSTHFIVKQPNTAMVNINLR